MDDSVRFQTRLLRALDGIAYALLGAVLVIGHPRLRLTTLGDLANLHMLPLLLLGLATVVIPSPPESSRGWFPAVLRLKESCLLLVGLAPFVSWWLRSVDSVYLLLAGAAAIGAAIWFFMELTAFLDRVFAVCGERRLAFDARVTRFLVFYLGLIPSVAVYVSFTAALWLIPGTVLSDLERTWGLVPGPVRVLMVLPVLNTIWLVWLAHRAVVAEPERFWREWSMDDSADTT